jgi:lysophospholipase-2
MSSPVVVSASGKHTATLIFLHGLGDTGHGWASTLVRLLSFCVKNDIFFSTKMTFFSFFQQK